MARAALCRETGAWGRVHLDDDVLRNPGNCRLLKTNVLPTNEVRNIRTLHLLKSVVLPKSVHGSDDSGRNDLIECIRREGSRSVEN